MLCPVNGSGSAVPRSSRTASGLFARLWVRSPCEAPRTCPCVGSEFGFGYSVHVSDQSVEVLGRCVAEDLNFVGDPSRDRWLAIKVTIDRYSDAGQTDADASSLPNRSFELQPATARRSSWPPLKPRPIPRPCSGRSTTSVWGPDHPIAVLTPPRLDVCTLNMPAKHTSGSQRRRSAAQ